jgi:hypothetical protein
VVVNILMAKGEISKESLEFFHLVRRAQEVGVDCRVARRGMGEPDLHVWKEHLDAGTSARLASAQCSVEAGRGEVVGYSDDFDGR